MKKIAFLLIFLLSVSFVGAAEIESGDIITIDQPVEGNLYIAGGTIEVSETINGDLVITGGKINVKGDVNGDITIAGGSVNIKNNVDGDVRIAGGQINVDSDINGDLVVVGGNTNIDGAVEKDLIVSGGNIKINGNVKGDAEINGGNVIIEGRIYGDVKTKADKLVITSKAWLNGNLKYRANKILIDERRIRGELTKIEKVVSPKQNLRILGKIMFMFPLFIGGVFVLLLFKRFSEKVAEKITKSSLASIGVGFLVLIATPIAAAILMATVIGIPIGLLLMFVYGFAIFFSFVFVSIIIGDLILKKRKRRKASEYLKLLVGVLVFVVLTAIPYVGPIVSFVAILAGLGSLFLVALPKKRPKKKK